MVRIALNDNEMRFRILSSIYSRKHSTFHRFHWLLDLLNDAGLSGEDLTRVQVFLERVRDEGRLSLTKNNVSAPHYLEDIEISTKGFEDVEKLMENTFDDPSPLNLTDDEKPIFEAIKNESNNAKKAKKFCDFILENKHHFFETEVFG